MLAEDIARTMLHGNITVDDLHQINEDVVLSEARTMRCAKKMRSVPLINRHRRSG